ncbi:hypothetical protein E1A91_D13G107400v1 [Gossypium mustelinum]|uniref:Uncharacterized protein n=1 Tax=Gossypium mustelinum TaxID=34275 RepID=A0A5D2S0E8_GOSMU|nr:hypothetical protein E1A91_D13G107400v1 [Gossypium mustelinum]
MLPCALPQTHLYNQKVSEVGQTNWSKNCLQLNGSRRSSEVSGISPFNLRNIDQRCAVATFPTLESDGQWRIFALPLQCFDHTNHLRSGNRVNMNDLHLVSSSSVNSFMVDRWKTQKGPQPAVTYPGKPFRGRSFSESNVQHQFRNKTFAGKINKFSEVSSNSSYHCSITCNDSSAVTSKGFNAMFIDCSKENKSKRRNSQKRTKKKGKHKKKQFCDVGSTESEVYPCNSNGAVTSSGSPNISTSDVDEVDITGSVVPTQVQKFPREHHINNSKIGSEDQQLSWCQGAIERKHLSHVGSLEGLHEKDFSDMHNSLALDSISVGSNSEDSTSAGHIVKPFNDNIHEISQSELPGSGTKKDSYHQKSLCGTIETHEYMGESKHGLAHSSLGGQMVASGKRGKKFKCIPGSPTTCKPGTMGSLHGRMITVNSQSVWQRVQKNPVEKCRTELKKTGPICSEFDVSLKDAPVLKRNPNATNRKPKSMVPRKFKRKVTPASKQENNSFSRKESCQKVLLDVSNPMYDHVLTKNLSRSFSQVDCPRLGTMKTESVNNFQAGPSSAEPCDTVCGTGLGLNNLCVENQGSLLQKSFVPLDQLNLLEEQTPVHVPHLMVNSVAQIEKGISLAENGKESRTSGSDRGLKTSSKSANLSLEHANGPDAEDWTSKNTFEENITSFSENLSSSVNARTLCRIGKDPGHGISFLENGNNIKKLRNLDACVNENENNHSGADYLIDETREQDLSAVATDLNKMAKALDDVYRAHMASEAVQMATGCPIAEFERLLHFCSPVICHSYSSLGCQTCLLDQTSNIPLGYLWQWYEKHGRYGLEIRAEDYKNPKRLGIDQFAFRAYFIPYLSAVQLFRNSKSHSTQNNTRISSPGVSVTSDISSTSRNSTNCGPIPIFSALVPQPHTAEPSSQLQVDDVFRSEPSPVSLEDMLPVKSVDISQSDCLELAFEYFESEQPQQRRALNEKYSVAWYPIYKIPDGNFRAAFLTYHSLGLLVRRRSKFDYPSVDASIVSPVVGLQSYNAQGECWFQPRHSTINDICGNQGLSPSWILKERLRTLEETASLMARAVVTKGNKTSVNRHPD